MKEKATKRYSVVIHGKKVREIASIRAKGGKVKQMTEFLRSSAISGYKVGKDGSAMNEEGNVIRFEEVTVEQGSR